MFFRGMDSVKLSKGRTAATTPPPPPKKTHRGPAEAGRKRGADPGDRSACSVQRPSARVSLPWEKLSEGIASK